MSSYALYAYRPVHAYPCVCLWQSRTLFLSLPQLFAGFNALLRLQDTALLRLKCSIKGHSVWMYSDHNSLPHGTHVKTLLRLS
jgi:hypothetical protein